MGPADDHFKYFILVQQFSQFSSDKELSLFVTTNALIYPTDS